MSVIKNQKFVVAITLEDGSVLRGIQKAHYAHPAIAFFAKANGVTYKAGSAEKLENFEYFLAKGLRKPLEAN